MDLIASFHSHKIKKFHFFSLSGLSTKGNLLKNSYEKKLKYKALAQGQDR